MWFGTSTEATRFWGNMPCSRPGAHRLRPGALQGTPFEPRGGVGVRCHIPPAATSCGARTFRKHVVSYRPPIIRNNKSIFRRQYDCRRSGACATLVVSFRVRLTVAPRGHASVALSIPPLPFPPINLPVVSPHCATHSPHSTTRLPLLTHPMSI